MRGSVRDVWGYFVACKKKEFVLLHNSGHPTSQHDTLLGQQSECGAFWRHAVCCVDETANLSLHSFMTCFALAPRKD